MKYRVKIDLFFVSEADALSLMVSARGSASNAVSINQGTPDEQTAFYELELCRHDDGLPCTTLERVEVRNFA